MSAVSTGCRSPTRRAVRRYAVAARPPAPADCCGRAVALHVLAALAALAAPRLLGDLVAGRRGGHHRSATSTGSCWLLAGFLRRCRPC